MAYAALTTLEEVKGWLGISNNSSDALLASLIESVSDIIGRHCGRDNLGEVLSYEEVYELSSHSPFRSLNGKPLEIVLDHYPVVSLLRVSQSNRDYSIITDPRQIHAKAGVFLRTDRRTIRISEPSLYDAPIVVNYTAGYAAADVPTGLQQCVKQFVGEVVRSKEWIGLISKGLAGETITYDQGGTLGLSKRTKGMLNPYINRIPSTGVGL